MLIYIIIYSPGTDRANGLIVCQNLIMAPTEILLKDKIIILYMKQDEVKITSGLNGKLLWIRFGSSGIVLARPDSFWLLRIFKSGG